MHELSISRSIVASVVRHADGRRVHVVRLRIGALRQVVPETLAFGFEIASRDTVCEGALLEHETIAAQLRCEDCATQWALAVLAFRCPTCNGRGAVISGEELTIEWIEVDDRCTV